MRLDAPHYLRFARALVLSSALGGVGCSAVVRADDAGGDARPDTATPPDDRTTTDTPVVPTDVADAQLDAPSACTCCPSGCVPCTDRCGFASPDGSIDNGPVRTPPAGSRWCTTSQDFSLQGCPIAGPLAPPEDLLA